MAGALPAPDMREIRAAPPEPPKSHIVVFSDVTYDIRIRTAGLREMFYFREACVQMPALTLPSLLSQ